jgi:hypothetical protein
MKLSWKFGRSLRAPIRDLTAMTTPLNRGKGLKTIECQSAFSVPRDTSFPMAMPHDNDGEVFGHRAGFRGRPLRSPANKYQLIAAEALFECPAFGK